MIRHIACISLVIVVAGCAARSQFMPTGAPRTPLADTANVTLLPEGNTDAYDTIGEVEVKSRSSDRRIEEAKIVARRNGGDYIMPKGPEDKNAISQTFLVLKTKSGDSVSDGKSIPDKDASDKVDYSALPRATYKMLLFDYRDLKDEKFRGALYPVRIVKRPPRALRRLGGEDDAVLLMSTKTGRNRLFVIVPEDKLDDVKETMKEKKKLSFIYTPVTLHRERGKQYPVLRLVDLQ